MNKQPIYYMQTDSRWKKLPYHISGSTATIGSSGCGPTCAAMLIATLTGGDITPVDTCAWAVKHGFRTLNSGTDYGYFVPQFEAFGINCGRLNMGNILGKPNSAYHEQAFQMLKNGYYLIACMGPGTWTSGGHYIVIWWRDGGVRINDPASKAEKRTWGAFQTFRNEVKYYWWIDAREYNLGEDYNMTDEKFAEFMARWMANQGNKPGDDWAKAHIDDAVELGITDGTRPKAIATRQDVMIMTKNAVLAARGSGND